MCYFLILQRLKKKVSLFMNPEGCVSLGTPPAVHMKPSSPGGIHTHSRYQSCLYSLNCIIIESVWSQRKPEQVEERKKSTCRVATWALFKISDFLKYIFSIIGINIFHWFPDFFSLTIVLLWLFPHVLNSLGKRHKLFLWMRFFLESNSL